MSVITESIPLFVMVLSVSFLGESCRGAATQPGARAREVEFVVRELHHAAGIAHRGQPLSRSLHHICGSLRLPH